MDKPTIQKDEPQARPSDYPEWKRQELAVVESTDLTMERLPGAVLDEARKAATALSEVIGNKAKPVIFNGEQYLEFEDWQTVGRFYGVTAKVESTATVTIGDVVGFEAVAVAIHTASGREISRAESMCMKDERNWSKKPLFQLRSMAQTRACAKALRNVLSWVVVLAGYRPTPAEEMEHEAANGERKATEKQLSMIYAKTSQRCDETGSMRDELVTAIKTYMGVESGKDIPMSRVDDVVQFIENWEPGQLVEGIVHKEKAPF